MSLTRLILIPALSSEPAPFLIVDAGGHVLERGLLAFDAIETPAAMRTVAVAPGAEVLSRWLDLPAGRPEQQRAAALWMLKDELATPADRTGLALGPARTGEPRLVAAFSLSLVEAWTDYLAALGVRADAIVPDVLAVPEPFDDEGLSAVAFGPSVALRGRGFAASVQPELVDLIAAGRTVTPVQATASVERMLVEAALRPAINLFETRGVRAEAGGSWRRAVVLAAMLLVSPLVLTVATAARDEMVARTLHRDSEAAARRVLPGLAPTVDPVAELERRLAVAPPPGGVAAATAALFAALEPMDGAELDSLVTDPAGGLRATVTYPNAADLERMKAAMAQSGLALTDTATEAADGRVVADILIGGPA